MAKNIRNVPGNVVQDPSILTNLEYNDAAGSKKVSEVGRHVLPVVYNNAGTISYTTDLTTGRQLQKKGTCLAVYNKDTALHAVTLGEDNTVAALAAGVTDANGHVGIPCAPGAWTYIACGVQNWVITDSAQLVVLVVDDESAIVQEASR